VSEATTTSRTDVAALVADFDANWRAGGPAADFVARFTPMLDPQIRLVQPQVPVLVGLEAFRRAFAEPLFELMPDARAEVLGWGEGEAGDVVYVECELTGTVGRQAVRMHFCDRLTLREGRIAERVAFLDAAPLLKAVALTPGKWPLFVSAQVNQRRHR
jgi:hypothetical protein